MKNVQNFNQIASDKRWVNLMGVMKTTRMELQQLAPNPHRNNKNAEVATQSRGAAANDDRDGALGSMVIESFLGAHFGMAVGDALGMPGWAQKIDWGNAIEIYDEYRNDTAQNRTRNDASGGSYSDMFNVTVKPSIRPSAEDMAWERYLQDLPNRRVLEQNLGALDRELGRIEKNYAKQQKLAFGM